MYQFCTEAIPHGIKDYIDCNMYQTSSGNNLHPDSESARSWKLQLGKQTVSTPHQFSKVKTSRHDELRVKKQVGKKSSGRQGAQGRVGKREPTHDCFEIYGRQSTMHCYLAIKAVSNSPENRFAMTQVERSSSVYRSSQRHVSASTNWTTQHTSLNQILCKCSFPAQREDQTV